MRTHAHRTESSVGKSSAWKIVEKTAGRVVGVHRQCRRRVESVVRAESLSVRKRFAHETHTVVEGWQEPDRSLGSRARPQSCFARNGDVARVLFLRLGARRLARSRRATPILHFISILYHRTNAGARTRRSNRSYIYFCSKEHDHSSFYKFLQMEHNHKNTDCYFFYYSTCKKVCRGLAGTTSRAR